MKPPSGLPVMHIFLGQFFLSNYGLFAKCGVIFYHEKPYNPVIFDRGNIFMWGSVYPTVLLAFMQAL
jgi:hypothetical protein